MPGRPDPAHRAPWRWLLAIAYLSLVGPAYAQVQRTFLNPSFEIPVLTAANPAAGCYRQLDETLVPGWVTTHGSRAGSGDCTVPGASTGRLIEMWRTSFQGVVARDQANFVELNADESSRMYQNVCLINGESIDWTFSHRGRGGSATTRDVMELKVGAASTVVRVGTSPTGTFDAPITTQGTAAPPLAGGDGWVDYAGNFAYAGANGTNSLGFESISTGSGSNTVGNFLDNIQIQLRPFVEFVQLASSTPESASNDVPTLRVNGRVFTAITVNVRIVGGTATLGADYTATTSGSPPTFAITIPLGVYDGAGATSLFPLPIGITQDVLVEGDETIQLELVPAGGSPPPFLLRSSSTCGAPAQTTWTYTIVDDDADIVLTKNAAAPIAVPGQPTQFDIPYTITVNNPTALSANYSLGDTPGLDPDVNILSAAFTLNGGTSTPLAGSGPWTLQPQWRALAGGATDTYVLTVRININRGGGTGNDACASPSAPGSGLHNTATATLEVAGGNTTFNASACRATPTPLWVTLNKLLNGRAVPTDQVQVRMFSGGILAASATTTGSAVPATASTGQVVLPAGNTLQFEEAVKANGSGPDQALTNYNPQITCSNATGGSTTVLPSGAGLSLGNRQQWSEFTPAAGDDIACTIANTARSADLAITKTNGTTTVTSGSNTTYTVVVTNNGPDPVTGAVVSDTPNPAGLTCPPANPVTCAPFANCPPGPLTIANLATGVTLPTLANGASATFTLTCTVQ